MMEKVIQNIFDSAEIKRIINQQKDKGEALTRILNYCVIMKSNQGMEKFAKLGKEKQVEFIKEKISEKIHTDDEKEIFKYACDSYFLDGFVYHTTNSLAEKEIMKNGLNAEQSLWDNEELLRIAEIYEEYGQLFALGWRPSDQKQNNGWFCSSNAKSMEYYAASPEWMNQFCGATHMYYFAGIPEEERKAYAKRDYDMALKNIKTVTEKLKMEKEDEVQVIDFFNKSWETFKDSKPVLILIPRKDVKMSYENLYGFYDINELERLLNGDFYEDRNKEIKEPLSPEHLKSVDISNLFSDEKILEKPRKKSRLEGLKGKKIVGFDTENEENKEVQELLEKALTEHFEKVDVKKYVTDFDFKEKVDNQLQDIFNYCMMTRETEGLQEYLKFSGKKNFSEKLKAREIIEEKIAKKLNNSERNKMLEYVYHNYVKNGYVIHATNSYMAENILKNGIGYNDDSIENSVSEIQEIYEKYIPNCGIFVFKKNQKTENWYYMANAKYALHYGARSPEWFDRFCGSSIDYDGIIPREKRSSFCYRDREQSAENIKTLMDEHNFSQEDRKKVMSFFEETWDKLGKSTPTMLLVPMKALDPVINHDLFVQQGDIYFGNLLTDECTDEYVSGDRIVQIDIPIQHEKLNLEIAESTKNSNKKESKMTLDDCVKKIRGLDPSKMPDAYQLLKILEKDELEMESDEVAKD